MVESDKRRFERIYEAYSSIIKAYVRTRAIKGLEEDAEAQIFEIAWQQFDKMPDRPLPWLFAIARNVLSQQRRADGRYGRLIKRIAAGELVAAAEDHADLLLGKEALRETLARLTKPQREALILVDGDGWSHREAAAVLGCSEGAVTQRLRRARMSLAAMDEYGPPPKRSFCSVSQRR